MRNRNLAILMLVVCCFIASQAIAQSTSPGSESSKGSVAKIPAERKALLKGVKESWPYPRSEQALKELWRYHAAKGQEKEFMTDLRSISDFRPVGCINMLPYMMSGLLDLCRKLDAAGENALAERCLGLILSQQRATGDRSIGDLGGDGGSGWYDDKTGVLHASPSSERGIEKISKWNGALSLSIPDIPEAEILKGNRNVIGFSVVGSVSPSKLALTESFPSLTELSVSPEHLFQLDKDILKRLTKLQVFQGEFTDAVAQRLCECSNLQTLTFNRGLFLPPASFDSPKSLERLKALHRLTQISFNDFTLNDDAITAIASLGCVKNVSLSRCPMLGVSSFAALRQVTTLDVSGLPLTAEQIESIAELPNLESVDLSYTKASTQPLESFTKLKKLKVLKLKECKLQSGSLETLAKLSSLEVLDLLNTGIPATEISTLSRLKNLQQLKYNFPENADDWLESLCNLKSLTELNLSYYYVSPEKLRYISGLKNLRQIVLPHPMQQIQRTSLFGLSALRLSMKPLTDQQIECFADLPFLRELVGGGNAITGSVFAHGFEKLEVLELPGCPVTDASIPALSRLPSLRKLVLSRNITGENIGLLAKCEHLEDLVVGSPAFELKNTPNLASLRTLKKLDLRGTTFSLPELQSLQKALPKCTISPDASYAELLLRSKEKPQLPMY